MTAGAMQWLYWTPRILGILFAIFISLFALDVFSEGYGFTYVVICGPLLLVAVLFLLNWMHREGF